MSQSIYLQCNVPDKLLSLEKFAHHALLLFYLLRDEKIVLKLSTNVSPSFEGENMQIQYNVLRMF